MSYDPDRSASQDFGEHYLHTINSRSIYPPDFYPPDFEIGFKHYKDQLSCIFCGKMDNINNLILCEDGNFRHPECEKELKKINDKFKSK